MLKDYKGPSNSPEILKYLVGDTVKGAFVNSEGHICLVFSSSDGLVFSKTGAYWKESECEVKKEVEKRREQINSLIDQLKDITFVD